MLRFFLSSYTATSPAQLFGKYKFNASVLPPADMRFTSCKTYILRESFRAELKSKTIRALLRARLLLAYYTATSPAQLFVKYKFNASVLPPADIRFASCNAHILRESFGAELASK